MTHREQRLDPVGVDKLQNGRSYESSFSHCAFLIIPPFCRGFRATRKGIQPSSMNNVSLYMTFIMPMPLTAKKRQSSRVYLKRHRAGRLSLDPVPRVKSFAKVHRQTKVWCSRHNFRSGSTLHGSWIDIVASQPSIKPRPKFEHETLTLSLVKRRKNLQLVPKFAVSSLLLPFFRLSIFFINHMQATRVGVSVNDNCSIVITSAIQSGLAYSIWCQAAERQLQWHLPNSSLR